MDDPSDTWMINQLPLKTQSIPLTPYNPNKTHQRPTIPKNPWLSSKIIKTYFSSRLIRKNHGV